MKAVRIAVALVIAGLTAYGPGCLAPTLRPTADLYDYYCLLVHRNHLDGIAPLPDAHLRQYMRVERFPGGFVVSWALPEHVTAQGGENPAMMLFDENERFICQPYEYVLGDVTGDGRPDIIAEQVYGLPGRQVSPTFVYMLYPMDNPTVPARFLWMVTGDAGPEMPKVVDLTGDGVPEIVGVQWLPYIDADPRLGTSDEEPPLYVVVWSAARGIPRLLLAANSAGYEIAPETPFGGRQTLRVFRAAPGFGTGPGEWVAIPWDEKERKFDISEAKRQGLQILQNNPMPSN